MIERIFKNYKTTILGVLLIVAAIVITYLEVDYSAIYDSALAILALWALVGRDKIPGRKGPEGEEWIPEKEEEEEGGN